ncbi:MAG: cupredoxin family copper-binding protein [Gemmatimonadota bacterium]
MIRQLRALASGALLCVSVVSSGAAQSLLDRSPNISGDWVTTPGTIDFNFLHRFVRSAPPARKVSNFPTFNIATSFLRRTLIGFNYSTNSALVPAYPNEWEFFVRALPIAQERGAPLDIGAQAGYNLAADGFDGELSAGRLMGPVRLTAVGRVLSNPYTKSGAQWAVGGGAVLKLTRHLALAGDAVSMTSLNKARGEKVAWSGGLQIAIPNTPHTLSLQVANTNTATLQGSSRGSAQKRYGFEFTIPITLARYFGHHAPPATPSGAVTPSSEVGSGGKVTETMKNLAFTESRIEIPAGTTVEWRNDDQLPHTVTAEDGSFESGPIEGGAVWRHTFTKPGTYAFHCTPHPFMKGMIVVR